MDVNDFDGVASYYDGLARLVFGSAVKRSQTAFLHLLDSSSKVLILGGGTGKILTQMPPVFSIVFMEKSAKMIAAAQKKPTQNEIFFRRQNFLLSNIEEHYDAILCPFFLDCFGEENLHIATDKLKQLVRPGGYLFVSDFEYDKVSSPLSNLMHWFFRITTNLESRKLKPIHPLLISKGFEMAREKLFYQNMIFSRVYRNL